MALTNRPVRLRERGLDDVLKVAIGAAVGFGGPLMERGERILDRFPLCLGQDHVVTLDPISELVALAHTEGGSTGCGIVVWALLVILLVIMADTRMSCAIWGVRISLHQSSLCRKTTGRLTTSSSSVWYWRHWPPNLRAARAGRSPPSASALSLAKARSRGMYFM